jgi:hypothetical protein
MTGPQQPAAAPPGGAAPAAKVQVSGYIRGYELDLIAEARRAGNLPIGNRNAYLMLLREIMPDYEGDPYPGMTGALKVLVQNLVRIIDRLTVPPAPAPGPCDRYSYPHTPHAGCPGQAPEYPSERVYTVTAHDDAADAYNRAEQAYHQAKVGAEQALEDANRELDAADAALRATESSPGVPLPEYRS